MSFLERYCSLVAEIMNVLDDLEAEHMSHTDVANWLLDLRQRLRADNQETDND